MGVESTIDYESFPKQSDLVGKRVRVMFKYDATHEMRGECVRDDREKPYRTIFRLDDGRFVLASECQYAPAREESEDMRSKPKTKAHPDDGIYQYTWFELGYSKMMFRVENGVIRINEKHTWTPLGLFNGRTLAEFNAARIATDWNYHGDRCLQCTG